MTTTVTLKAHSWPVDVTTTDGFGRALTTTIETVQPETERHFHISDTRSIAFAELPVPAVEPEADSPA